jgi:TonB family protein
VAASSIFSVRGKIPFTKEIGSVVLLRPLDALWPTQKYSTIGEGGVSSPECVYCPNLDLADEEVETHMEGVVLVTATITSEGSVTPFKVIKRLDSELDERAVESLKMWQLKPATNADGEPIPVRTTVEIVVRRKPGA